MNQEIYSDADDDVMEALLVAKRVDDFLPPPSELTRAQNVAAHKARSNRERLGQTSAMRLARSILPQE